MPALASFLSQSSHCSLYLCNWYMCHLDGHRQSCKFWSNFPTTLHSSSHYTAQWILMALIFPWEQNQILKLALPSLSLPCHAYILIYSILVGLSLCLLPTIFTLSCLRPCFLTFQPECLIPSPFCESKLCLEFQTTYITHPSLNFPQDSSSPLILCCSSSLLTTPDGCLLYTAFY